MTQTLFSRLWRDEDGVSMIELALALPILALLVTGGADVASGFAAKVALQQATARTIEKATAGGLNSTAFQSLQAEGAAAAGVPASAVTVTQWLECDAVKQADFNGACTDTQQVGRYVSIKIDSSYRPTFNFFTWSKKTNGVVPLTATSSVRVQ